MIPVALGALLLASAGDGRRAEAPGPPGTILVPSGRCRIGIDRDELDRMIAADPEARAYAGALSAETPRREVDVPAFWLQATEVTNEQYAVYVAATGARPPESWGAARIARGRARHLEDEARRREASSGEGSTAPHADPFDAHAWWRAHWSDASPDLPAFEVPPGDGLRPVVFVDWDAARAYARWAGLRLPTEVEYQRAAREDGGRTYPWGEAWEDGKYAATSTSAGRAGAAPVGSFPLGASRRGAHDLAGNVWEWTSSPYLPYPGYEPRVIAVGFGGARHAVNAIADWDAEQRVVVGGSFQNGRLMARATTRRAAERSQATDALGFRCAASARPGVDEARAILEHDLTENVRARGSAGMVEYAPEATVCVEGWATVEAGRIGAEPGVAPRVPPGHAVIAGYRRVLFTPVRVVPASDPTGLERLGAVEGLVALGFLSTNLACVEPALPAGTYQVLWRPRGARSAATRGGAGPEEAPLEEVLAIDPSSEHLVLFDAHGRPALALACRAAWETVRESRVEWLDPATLPRTGEEPAEAGRVVRFDLCLPTRSGQKGVRLELVLRLARDELNASWRPR